MKRIIIGIIGWSLMILSVYWTVTQLRWTDLTVAAKLMIVKWPLLLLMFAGYAAAFWLRSMAWAVQLGSRRVAVGQLWHYHHVGLLVNHLLPVKGGELIRAALLRKKHQFSWAEAIVAVGYNRLIDMGALLSLSAIGIVIMAPEQVRSWFAEKVFLLIALIIAGIICLFIFWYAIGRRRLDRWVKFFPGQRNRWGLIAAFLLTAAGWVLEAVVIWSVVYALGQSLPWGEALLVHVLTIMGQTFHVTPGGLGTYEAVMSALLVEVAHLPLSFALQAAIFSHGFKFLYSFLVGGFAASRLALSPLAFFRQAVRERKEGDL